MKLTKDTEVEFIVETGLAGSNHEDILTLGDLGINPDLDPEALEKILDGESQEFMANHIGCSWRFVEEDNDEQ